MNYENCFIFKNMFFLKVDFDSKKWLLSFLNMRNFICILVLIGNM